jgi:hypothetical protein
MTKHEIQLVAETLCKFDGHMPYHCSTPDEPQWARYVSQARAVLRALETITEAKHDDEN